MKRRSATLTSARRSRICFALKPRDKGKLVGRVMSEALNGGTMPKFAALTKRSAPGANGLRTVLLYQTVGKTMYFDAAGFPGRTVGLENRKAAANQ